jgi:hypothetical protein
VKDRWSDTGPKRPMTHESAWELLPWLANGTLERDEREAVEAHVAACGECKQELDRCRALGEQVRGVTVAPSPHPAQLQALMRRIDDSESVRRWPQPFAGHPKFVRGALLAQAAVIVVLLGLAFWPARQGAEPQRYRTLSDAPAALAPMGQIRLVFRSEATEAQMRQLILDVRGEIVGGPSALGAYTVAVPASGPGAEPIGRVLEHLRADPRVRLAEPVAGLAPAPAVK